MATRLDLELDQGSYAVMAVTVEESPGVPKDLTGFTVESEIRKSYRSATSVQAGTTLVTPASGLLQWSLPSATSFGMNAGSYVYDIRVIEPGGAGESYRVLQGVLVLSPAVSKP